MVFAKKEVGAEEKIALPVELLTAVLKSNGVLEQLLRDLGELSDLPASAFEQPGAYGGKGAPGDAVEMGKSLIRQLQDVTDVGIFERREEEIRVKERALASRELAVAEQEKVVEEQFKALIEVKEDEQIKLIRMEQRRLRELYHDAWLAGVSKSIESPIVDEEPPKEAEPVPMEEPFELVADEDDVQELINTSEVKGYNGKSEFLSWLEY